jgi:hypothetical protein
MPTSIRESVRAIAVRIMDEALVVDLEDGRVLQVPLEWFPSLLRAEPAQRMNVRLVGRGIGLHWPELDEDLSIDGLLQGRPSVYHQLPSGADDGDNESPADGSPLDRYRPEVH